ncbi:methyltransferase family protein [Hyphococcus sp.]|uniref:methyltransferase family protein n=1 Tax=Hyphococcus sp. TaxID=2038636 RepID=UPI003CCC10AF
MDQETLRFAVAGVVILLMLWMIGFGLLLKARGIEANAIAEAGANYRQKLLIFGAGILDFYLILRAPFPQMDKIVAAQSSPAPLLALALLGVGGAIIIFSQSGMGESWRVGVPHQKNHVDKLVVKGLHQFSRNPVYLGIMVFLTGALAAAPGPFTLFAVLISFLGLTIIIRQEEHYLEERFAEQYRTYKKRVRRWI